MVDDPKEKPAFERDRDGGVVALHGEPLPRGVLRVERDLAESATGPQPSTLRADAVISGVYAHAERLRGRR